MLISTSKANDPLSMYASKDANSLAVWLLFGLYIVSLILLPAGSIVGINVRMLFFLPLILVAANRMAHEKTALMQFAFAAAVACLVSVSIMRSLLNPFYAELAFSQAKDLLVTLIGCLFVRLLTQTSFDREKFVRLCIYTAAFGGLLKLLLLAYSIVTGASISNIVDAISAVFGITLMSMDIDGAGGRLQLPSDMLLPIALFAAICLRRRLHLKAPVAALVVMLLVFSSVYTFSRFIWANTVIAVLLGLILAGGDKIILVYFMLTAGATAYLFPLLSALVTLRFSTEVAGSSDGTRVEQIAALKQFFWDAPFFGHGIGSYVLTLVRSSESPYVYEVQAGALLCQFGVIGMGVLCYLLGNYYWKAFDFQSGRRAYQAAVLLLLIIFLGAGLSNPNLMNSVASVSYGLIFVLALIHPGQQGSAQAADRTLSQQRVPQMAQVRPPVSSVFSVTHLGNAANPAITPGRPGAD